MSKKTFTTQFNRTTSSIRDVNCKKFTAPCKVQKSLAYAVDINNIYDDYVRTNKLPLNGATPIYDENFVKYDSLIEAQKLVSEATQYFAGLPADIKNQYGNSLPKFIKAVNSKDDFLIQKGLLNLPDNPKTVDNVFTELPNPSSEKAVSETVNTVTTD